MVREKKSLDLASVSVVSPGFRQVSTPYSVIGSISAWNEVSVISETSGRIIAMPAAIGAQVASGSALVYVDKDLRQAAFLAAEAAYAKAQKDAERAASLHQGGIISDADSEAAKLGETSARAQYLVAKKEYENTTISSPIAGTVADTFVSLGGQVAPGSKVALVVDVSRLKVKVLLPERGVIRQRVGGLVSLSTDLFPDRSFQGHIESISVRGDDAHSFPVEVVLQGDAAKTLRAGMSVRLDFTEGSDRKVLLIPRSTIVGSVQDSEVFVVTRTDPPQTGGAAAEGLAPAGLASKRKIVTGDEYGTDIEVLSGLGVKDLVVNGGQSLLADGQEVRIVSEGGSDDTH